MLIYNGLLGPSDKTPFAPHEDLEAGIEDTTSGDPFEDEIGDSEREDYNDDSEAEDSDGFARDMDDSDDSDGEDEYIDLGFARP